MKVPLSWLQEFVEPPLTTLDVAKRFTELGIEVEGISNASFPFEGVVVAKVLSVAPHPNAERLRVATVTDGVEEHQIVCGAPNCQAGLMAPLAKIGASLKDLDGKTWKIKKSRLRDVDSFGMLCSAKELGLSMADEGLLELPSNWPLGATLESCLSDPVLEVSLTPNLGHCQSVLGLSRELAASLETALKKPICLWKHQPEGKLPVSVANHAPQACRRYMCRGLRGVCVGPSPDWLKRRLELAGMRSINNVVDVTNYVMLELGQPLHAFDVDRLVHGQLGVKIAEKPTQITTLDGQERAIPEGSLLIYDGNTPVAIGGIMGGMSSSVTEETKTIVVEAALFTSGPLRKLARALDLKTESSMRFDRGVDPAFIPVALDRAILLIQQVAGGTIYEETIDLCAEEFVPRQIVLRLQRLNQLLGTELSLNEVISFLKRLEMKATLLQPEILVVEVPTYRGDLALEVDLIEEVARIFGYHHIPRRSCSYTTSTFLDTPMYLFEKKIREFLVGQGLQECVTCDLISPEQSKVGFEKGLDAASSISVLHPRSVEQSVLRSCLLPGLLQMASLNQNYGQTDMAAFEIGRIHFKQEKQFCEQTCVGFLLQGKKAPHHFEDKPDSVDFFDLKGIIERLLESCHLEGARFESSHLHSLHPWRQAKISIQGQVVGVIGEVSPEILDQLKLDQRLYFGEINLNDLIALKGLPSFEPLPLFPSSERDWTISLREETMIGKVMDAIETSRPRLLEAYSLRDLYRNEKLGKGKKNATFRFIYRDREKTVDIASVEKEHEKLLQSLAKKLADCVI